MPQHCCFPASAVSSGT